MSSGASVERRTSKAAARPRSALGHRIAHVTSRWALLGVLGALVLGFSLWEPNTFATQQNFSDIVSAQPPSIFIAFAAMLTLVVLMFDLSLGATLGMSQFLVMKLMTETSLPWPLCVLLALFVGVAVGGVNAVLVIGLKIHSFIATIGVATVLTGLLQWISNGGAPIFAGASPGFLKLGQSHLAGLSLPVVYSLVAALLLWLMLEYTVLGRQLRATGANRQAADLSGIPTSRSIAVAFVGAGLLAAAGGVIGAARIGSADISSGPDLLLPAFAAAFLGATAVKPGFFNVWGTVIAIFLVAVGITGLQLKGVASWVTPVFNGVVLLAAVAVSNVATARKGRAGALRGRGRPRAEAVDNVVGGPLPAADSSNEER